MSLEYISEKDEYLIYQIHQPFTNVKQISLIEPIFKIALDNWKDLFDVYFRWSSNGIEFSDWNVLTFPNMSQFTTCKLYEKNMFWLHFKFQLKQNLNEANQITNINITLVKNDEPKLFVPFPIEFDVKKGNTFYPVTDFSATWNVYGTQQESIRLYKDLSFDVNNLFGIPCKYIKSDPKIDSKDLFLLEWGLYHHDQPVDLKVIVPDNQFPENQFNFNMYGIDFEMPFEVLIDKRYFENYYGIGSSPQRFDVIYIPMVDRIYEIESSALGRDFMQEPIYHKLSLRKYSKRTNVLMEDDTKQFLDDLTTGVQELFENDWKVEEKKITNELQFKERSDYIDVRNHLYDSALFVKDYELRNNNILISDNYYDFTELYKVVGNSTGIRYNVTNSSNVPNQICTFWCKIPVSDVKYKIVRSVELMATTIKIKTNVLPPNIKVHDYLSIRNVDNGVLYYAKVMEIDKSKMTIDIERNDTLLNTSLDIYPWLFEYNDLKCGITQLGNILSNMESNVGWNIELIDGELLFISINTNKYYFKVDFNTGWNAFIVQFLKTFNQISFYQYVMEDGDLQLHSSAIKNLVMPNYFNDKYFYIKTSPIILTNLRVFTESIKVEDHKNILYQNIVTDSHKCIIIDNAMPSFVSPFIGNVK